MMCLRNGMNIPPMMLPLSMQQLQMSMLTSIGPMGLGMGMAGMGLGMGMGMMDMNSAANTGRAALVPMGQPLPGAGSHAVPVSVHPRDTNGLSTENNELKLRLQNMEQQVHLRDGSIQLPGQLLKSSVLIRLKNALCHMHSSNVD